MAIGSERAVARGFVGVGEWRASPWFVPSWRVRGLVTLVQAAWRQSEGAAGVKTGSFGGFAVGHPTTGVFVWLGSVPYGFFAL